MKKKKICVFTGTRAEYGLLRPVIQRLSCSAEIDFRLIVSGSHLSASRGYTEQQILDDGFTDFERVEILLDSDSDVSVCSAMALGLLRYGDVLTRISPELVMILGDRFEALAFAASATICRIPIAHIHGGELTVGAIDDAFRHAITKMSHLHFAATEKYRRRIIQMGEHADRVFNVGALGVENVKGLGRLPRFEVESRLGITAGQKYFLVTYHPVTLDTASPGDRLKQLITVLRRFPNYVAVFTGANADQGGALLNRILDHEAKVHPDRVKFFMSLGTELYLSAARYADVVIGNSSSGVIEVPSLGVPVVDIGIRQQGRDRSDGVISCTDNDEDILCSIGRALTPEFREEARTAHNPYDAERTASRIVETLIAFCDTDMLNKGFVDIF